MAAALPARPPTYDLVVTVDSRTVVCVPSTSNTYRRARLFRELAAGRRFRGLR